MTKTIEEILEHHCPSMNNLYLDNQGREFRKRILSAMEEYAGQNLTIPSVIGKRPDEAGIAAIKMKFKDAPVGARFKYPNGYKTWVKINSYPKSQLGDGYGLICEWNGNIQGLQSFCSFVDEEENIDFDTEVELV